MTGGLVPNRNMIPPRGWAVTPQTNDKVHQLLAAFGVKRHDGDWFLATKEALTNFIDGEVLEKRWIE